MPKIFLLISSFYAGGVQRVTINLANELAKLGYPTSLVVISRHGPLRAQVLPGVTVHDLNLSKAVRAVYYLAKLLRMKTPDIFISNQTHLNVLSVLAHKLARSSSELLIVEHNHMSSVVQHANNWVDRLRPFWAKIFYPHANRVLAVSEGVANDLAQLSGIQRKDIHVVINSILPPSFEKQERAILTHPWFTEHIHPVIVGMGRLSIQKDFKTLIRSVAKANEIRPIHLAIFGEGEQRSDLAALAAELGIEDKLWMPGYVEDPFSYITQADIFILSSIWEGFPSVLVEAMACGTSVLSTDCPAGPREILADGKYGKLVPVGDVAAMADGILDALSKPQEATVLAKRTKIFTSSHAVTSYTTLFKAGFEQHG